MLFFGCLLLQSVAFSQDKIYQPTSTKQGTIIGINENVVAYHPTAEKTKTINIPLRTAALLFNEKGGYLIPAKLDMREDKAKQAAQSFLSQQSPYWSNDMIFKADKTVWEGNISEETKDYITIETPGGQKKETRNSIVIIIYKDGRHQIIGSLENTISLLGELRGPFAGITAASAVSAVPTVNVVQPETNNAAAVPARPLVIDDLINSATKAAVEEKATNKTRAFTNYMKILFDKNTPPDERNKTVDLTKALFVNDSAKIETSSVNRTNIRRRTIKKYLDDMLVLPYEKIEVQWTNIQYIDDLKAAPDGTFRGTVTFEQTFSGFNDGQLVYKDITKKSAEVILRGYTKTVNGEQVLKWDILLGDIGVAWTQKPI